MKLVYNSDSVVINSPVLKELSILSPWKSILAIAFEWLVIAACITIHQLFPFTIVYFVVWVIISTRLYALYSLLHDAIHYSITRNKKVNDFIGQVFLGFPLFISLSAMRKNHFDHHKFLQTENDPEIKHLLYSEFQFPKKKWEILGIFLRDLLGLNFLYYKLLKLGLFFRHLKKAKMTDIFYLLFLPTCAALAIYFHIWKEVLLYWIIPYATIYQVLNRLRLSTEHFNIDDSNLYKTRSVNPPFAERILVSPYNLGYHLEHHLYPGVPFYNLPRLHKLLVSSPGYTANAEIYAGYMKVLKDFIK